jgi:hypothetical protein
VSNPRVIIYHNFNYDSGRSNTTFIVPFPTKCITILFPLHATNASTKPLDYLIDKSGWYMPSRHDMESAMQRYSSTKLICSNSICKTLDTNSTHLKRAQSYRGNLSSVLSSEILKHLRNVSRGFVALLILKP